MMAKEIQKIMIEQDIKKCELAAKLNTTSSNLYNKLKIEFIPKEDK